MRVAILTQYYPPEIGAPQNRLSELAKRFVAQGHEVFVLTGMPNYPTGRIYPGYRGVYRREVMEGIIIKRAAIFPTKSLELVPRLLNYFSFVISSLIVGTLTLPKVDFLVTESPPLFLGISGYILSRLKRARFIFNVSDLWPESAVRMGLAREGVLLRLAWKLERFCYENAWLVSGQSREILENIGNRFPDVRLHYLSNGVDTTVFRPTVRSQALHDELAEGRCLAVYAGLHGAAQGLDQLLDAASLLRDLKDLTIVLAGDGPEKEALQRRANALGLDNVRFLPPFPHHRMPALVASADIAVVVLKSHLPGAVPSKIYEAMGSGVPILLAAEGEAAALVRDSGSGVVVPPGNSPAIATALRELVHNKAKRWQMGEQGRQTALARFDRRNICQGFIELLESDATVRRRNDFAQRKQPSSAQAELALSYQERRVRKQ